MNKIEYSANQFLKSINLRNKKITYKKLLKAIRKNGYIVKGYSESSILLVTFGLYDDSKEADSVSTIDKDGVPYIFINNDIDEIYRLFTLAHELGHIILKHRKTASLKKQQERAADLFAHYLLLGNCNQKLNIALTSISILLCVYTIFIIMFAPQPNIVQTKTTSTDIQSFIVSNNQEITNNSVCYYARYSEVYHLYMNCYYLKNSKKICTDTIDKCHLDRLCSACERRLNNK